MSVDKEAIPDNEGYYHFELNVFVSTKETDFSQDKMFSLIASAIRGDNENRHVCAGQPYASELIKENEELKKRVIELQSADMTHEYNNAEAERVWPQIKEQIEEPLKDKIEALEILFDACKSANLRLQSEKEVKADFIEKLRQDIYDLYEEQHLLQSDNEYWKQRCEAAEALIYLDGTNNLWREKLEKYEALKQTQRIFSLASTQKQG